MYTEGMSVKCACLVTYLKSSLRWWIRLVYSFNTRTVSLHLIEWAESITAFLLSSARAALVLIFSPTEGCVRRGGKGERGGRGRDRKQRRKRRERGREASCKSVQIKRFL